MSKQNLFFHFFPGEVEDVDESFSKRKRKKTKSEDDGDDSPRVISPNKRKKELGHCSKKMKICASNQKLFTSSSCGRLYHCNKIIKRKSYQQGYKYNCSNSSNGPKYG